MDHKRKLTDVQSPGCCASRNVRQRLETSPPTGRDAPVMQSNRQRYQLDDDPYCPDNALPCNKASDMQFRRAYIRNSESNAARDPLVRVCIQDYLNTKFNVQDINSFSVMSDMDAYSSNMSDSTMLELEELVDEEIVHKFSWLLAEKLNTLAKWETAMTRVAQVVRSLHGYAIPPIEGGRLQLRLNGPEPADASNTALPTPPEDKPSQDPHGSTHHTTQIELRRMETNATSDPATTTEPNDGSSKGKRRHQNKGSGPATKADPKALLVKNSFRSRIRLFMFQKGRVFSLSKKEARLVFESPKYLYAWMNINRAVDQFDGEPRPYQVEAEINAWYKEDMDKAKADWNVFWDELDHRYDESLAPLEQTKDGKQLSTGQPCSTSTTHDALAKEQDEQAVKVESSGTSRSLSKRADHPNFATKDSNSGTGEIDVVTIFTTLDELDEAGPSTPKANRHSSIETAPSTDE